MTTCCKRYRAVLRKLVRIGQQVDDHLLQTLDVRTDFQAVCSAFEHYPVGRPARLCHGSRHLHADLHHVALLQGESNAVGFQAGHIQYVVYQPEQQVRVGFDYLEISALVVYGGISGGKHVRESHNGVQRRTYLMAHIGEERAFQAVGLFRPVLRLTQGGFGHFQLVFQPLGAVEEIERDEQARQQDDQNGSHSPYMVLILLIEARSDIHQPDGAGNRSDIELPLLHQFAVHDSFAGYNLYLGVLRVCQHTDSLPRHIPAQRTVDGRYSAHSPVADAYGRNGECGQAGSGFHHGISGVAHEVTVVHVHAPCAHQQNGARGQRVQFVTDGINRVDTPVQEDKA